MIRKIELLTLALLLLIIGTLSLNWALKGAIHYQKDVLVPDLTSKPLAEALFILSELNLAIQQDGTEFNDTIPANTVVRQQPPAGMSVREGKVVRVTISQGGEVALVPDLTGQSLRSAEIALRTNLLSLGEVQQQPSVKYEKDFIVSQDPPARKIVSKNTFVHIVISNGPPEDGTILMPDFVGKNRSEPESWSKETGIRVEMSEETSLSSPETVLRQDLPPDSPVQAGTTVRFVVASSRPDEPKTSPDAPSNSPDNAAGARYFHYDVPQGESPKNFIFILVDSSGSREIFRGKLEPGSKKPIPLPLKIGPSATVRIFVNGILTGERNIQ